MSVSVLFCRSDSLYKTIPGLDVWDIDRDATNFSGSNPVICHPPCRSWGKLKSLSKPRPGERELAIFSMQTVRANGGVLEHPLHSDLWKLFNVSPGALFADDFGGFCIDIDQYDFGHVARKPTRLYVCGLHFSLIPPLPGFRSGFPLRSISGEILGTKACTKYQREYTPLPLITWLLSFASRVGG
jgi:hypothetical protein